MPREDSSCSRNWSQTVLTTFENWYKKARHFNDAGLRGLSVKNEFCLILTPFNLLRNRNRKLQNGFAVGSKGNQAHGTPVKKGI